MPVRSPTNFRSASSIVPSSAIPTPDPAGALFTIDYTPGLAIKTYSGDSTQTLALAGLLFISLNHRRTSKWKRSFVTAAMAIPASLQAALPDAGYTYSI
jgi:hypothetical protein